MRASRRQFASPRAAGLVALAVLAALLLAGCANAPPPPAADSGSAPPAMPAPEPASPPSPDYDGHLTLEQANDVTLYAISLVGTPYVRGGNTPDGGFDCSGLIAYVYKTRANLKVPRTVATLRDWGTPLPARALRSGDLVLFARGGRSATHAGIYVGEGRFVHAPSTGGVVRLDSLASPYWSSWQASFRRP